MKRFIALLVMTVMIGTSFSVQAQTSSISGVRRNIATIIFCGLGGAVLGLSTLSFYGKPQENIGNITTGFGLGVIAGTIYVTTQTTMDQSFQNHDQKMGYQFASMTQKQKPPLFTMAFDF
ncbi:MAG: hypothetical protein BroJett040_08850 [Oligoflexia bacterium]|nr:MAG: hypothetical protein BroJett040_08850 [Oligoflexia bacterium]